MIKTLQFQNFKSWRNVNLECGNITGFFGTNSSGKTSLIQFLLMLKQTKNGTDRAISLDLNGDLVSLGTISDVIFGHNEDLDLKWHLEFALESDLALHDPTGKKNSIISRSNSLAISAANKVQTKAPKAHSLSYKLGGMTFSLTERDGQPSKFELTCESDCSVSTDFNFIRTKGRAWQLPGPIKSYAFPDQARTYFQNAGFLADLEASYEAQLDKIFYLGPLRQYPQRDYLWARSRPTDVGAGGEKAIDAILAATEAGEQRNLKAKGRLRSFQEMIAYWLREMGLVEEFRVEEIAQN